MSEKGRVDMAIIEGTNSDGTKYYQYQQPDREILRKRFNELLERLEELVKCLPELNFDVEDLAINGRILGDIIVRVDKRSDYFLIFHEQTHISEIKKAALYAYWILKLKPLSVVSPIIEKRTRDTATSMKRSHFLFCTEYFAKKLQDWVKNFRLRKNTRAK